MSKRKRLNYWQRYEYKHTTLAILSVVLFALALDTALVQTSLSSVESLGLWGLFIAGILFTSFFTVAPATALLLYFANMYDPLTIGAVGGLGALVGDWIILKFFEERIAYELKPLIKKLGLGALFRRLRRRKERERTLLLGMLVIFSPLPDELGIGLMGLSRLPLHQLLSLIYVLNSMGIMLIAVASTTF